MKKLLPLKSVLLLIFIISSCDKTHEFPDTVKDIDGNIYKTVAIGSQLWMKENLRTTRYSDGSSIPNVIEYDEWVDRTVDGFCWYRNDTTYKNLGALYNYYAVVDPRNVCPEGWHIPSDNEWKTLEVLLGLSFNDLDKIGMRGTNQGDFLKATFSWVNHGGGNNIIGFSALPSSARWYSTIETDEEGFGLEIGYVSCFWSPAKNQPENYSFKSLCRMLVYNEKRIGRGGGPDWIGIPARCIKD